MSLMCLKLVIKSIKMFFSIITVIKKIVSLFCRIKGSTHPITDGVLRYFNFQINKSVKKISMIKKCKVNSVICITTIVHFIEHINNIAKDILIK